MVLQRDEPIPVWGKAAPGSKVEVTFGNLIRSVVAANDSTWKLPAQTATYQPQSLKISSGDTAVQFNNILIGDIWICIGQSNMSGRWSGRSITRKRLRTAFSHFSVFIILLMRGKNIFETVSLIPWLHCLPFGRFYKGYWQACDSSSIKSQSAVAWYFGKQLAAELNIPVGWSIFPSAERRLKHSLMWEPCFPANSLRLK